MVASADKLDASSTQSAFASAGAGDGALCEPVGSGEVKHFLLHTSVGS